MRYVKESRIAAAPEDVFAFHESAGALSRLIPPWESVRVAEGGESLLPGSRAVLEIQVKPLPFRLRWIAEHCEYQRGRMFADRQVAGPFASWLHRHWFLDDGKGGTILRDEIDFEPPLGVVGRWLGGAFILGRLEKMFEFRHEQTKKAVEAKDFRKGLVITSEPSCDLEKSL